MSENGRVVSELISYKDVPANCVVGPVTSSRWSDAKDKYDGTGWVGLAGQGGVRCPVPSKEFLPAIGEFVVLRIGTGRFPYISGWGYPALNNTDPTKPVQFGVRWAWKEPEVSAVRA